MLPRTPVVVSAVLVCIVFPTQISKAEYSRVKGCGVDLAFIVDNSASIRDSSLPGQNNWLFILDFLKTLVGLIKVSSRGNHVGLVEFGNQGYIDFDFTAYMTSLEVISALDRLKYRGENSNMTGGMRLARQRLFNTKYGMRPDVPHVIILVTYGIPTYDADKLPEEVQRIKNLGIRIMALGVTNKVNKSLMQSIVTPPHDKNYVSAKNFGSLDFIVNELSSGSQMCSKVVANDASTQSSVTTTTTTTTSKSTISSKAIIDSYGGCLVDVAFVVDNSRTFTHTWIMMVNFLETLFGMLNISPEGTLVGLVEFGNEGYLGFDFSKYTSRKEVTDAVGQLVFRGENSNTTGGMRLARERLFNTKYGMRPNVRHVMILVTYGVPTYDADKLPEEVQRIKNMGIRIMAVGITNEVNETLLWSIVEQPPERNYVAAESFTTPDKILHEIYSDEMCKTAVTSSVPGQL